MPFLATNVKRCGNKIPIEIVPYAKDNASMERDQARETRSCFDAVKDRITLRICEVVTDARGNSCPEISAWYWPALSGQSKGP